MSDWEIVEEALTFPPAATLADFKEARTALARLRAREQELIGRNQFLSTEQIRADVAEALNRELASYLDEETIKRETAEARVHELEARVAERYAEALAERKQHKELEAALREIAETSRDHRMRIIARRALEPRTEASKDWGTPH